MPGLLGFPFYVCVAFRWAFAWFIVMFCITFRFIIYIIIDDCISLEVYCAESDLKGAFALLCVVMVVYKLGVSGF